MKGPYTYHIHGEAGPVPVHGGAEFPELMVNPVALPVRVGGGGIKVDDPGKEGASRGCCDPGGAGGWGMLEGAVSSTLSSCSYHLPHENMIPFLLPIYVLLLSPHVWSLPVTAGKELQTKKQGWMGWFVLACEEGIQSTGVRLGWGQHHVGCWSCHPMSFFIYFVCFFIFLLVNVHNFLLTTKHYYGCY